MTRPTMFLALVPKSNGRYDAFIPAVDAAAGVRVPVTVPGVGMMECVVREVDTAGAVALCVGAAAGISGLGSRAFLARLEEVRRNIEQLPPMPGA